MKRKISVLLAVIFTVVSICACKKPESGPVEYKGEIPQYTSDEEFYIGMWVGPPTEFAEYDEDLNLISTRAVTDEDYDRHYRLIKEAGFGYVDCGLGQISEAYYLNMLPYAEKYQLKQYVYDDKVSRMLMDEDTEEEILVRDVKRALEKYTKYSSFGGLRITDEPTYSEIASFSWGSKIFKQACPNSYYFINLFPTYAPPSYINNDYSSYIREYVNKIDTPFVCYDYYPMQGNGRVNSVSSGFLNNMLEVQLEANGRDMWTFLQALKFGSRNRALTSVADATFQAYSFLAFGGKGIHWFCYFTPPPHTESFGEGCIGWDGEPTAVYDYVKTANLEIRNLEDTYLNFDWKGFMLSGNSENFELVTGRKGYMDKHSRIKSFSSDQSTLTGVFKDGEGRDGFMIVNFTEPSNKTADNLTITFNNATGALIYKKGQPEVVGLKNGKLDIVLEAGEGYFVIPLV